MDEKVIQARKSVVGNHQLLRAGNIAATLVYAVKHTNLEWDDSIVQVVLEELIRSIPLNNKAISIN